jgi:hypothetical protein
MEDTNGANTNQSMQKPRRRRVEKKCSFLVESDILSENRNDT